MLWCRSLCCQGFISAHLSHVSYWRLSTWRCYDVCCDLSPKTHWKWMSACHFASCCRAGADARGVRIFESCKKGINAFHASSNLMPGVGRGGLRSSRWSRTSSFVFEWCYGNWLSWASSCSHALKHAPDSPHDWGTAFTDHQLKPIICTAAQLYPERDTDSFLWALLLLQCWKQSAVLSGYYLFHFIFLSPEGKLNSQQPLKWTSTCVCWQIYTNKQNLTLKDNQFSIKTMKWLFISKNTACSHGPADHLKWLSAHCLH